METGSKQPVSIYLSYAQKDEALKEEFEDYLIIMQQSGLISAWIERQVQRGIDWSQVIDPRLLVADIVLLLVSPSLVASGYCSGVEIYEAVERSKKEEARVIPIMLHYVNLVGHPFSSLQSLPRNGIPISSCPNRSEVWGKIDSEIRHVIKDLTFRQTGHF